MNVRFWRKRPLRNIGTPPYIHVEHRAEGRVLNLDDLNKWSTLITNIGVIAGIVFLGYELNQNNQNLEAQARFNYRDGRAEGNLQNAHDPAFAEIMVKSQNGEELTQVERFQFDAYLRYLFVNWEWGYAEALARGEEPNPVSRKQFFTIFPRAVDFWSTAKYSYDEAFQDYMENEVLSDLNLR